MTPRTFVKLAIAAAVSSVAAITVYASNAPWSEAKASGQKLVPALGSASTKIGSVVMSQGGNTLTLVPAKDNRWTIKERSDYPADIEPIRALLTRLQQAERVEGKTRNAERHSVLEVEALGKDAKSRGLKLLDAKGAAIADLTVGKKKVDAFGSGKGGTYVRSGAEPQAWLANAELDVSADVKRWIKPGVFDTDVAKITETKIEVTGEEPLEIARTDGKLSFKGIPVEGKKLKDPTAADSIVRAAAQIDADDVRKLDQTPTGAGVTVATLKGEKGLEMVMRLRRDGDTAWVSVAASGEGEAKAAADAIMAKTRGWEFKVPTSKLDAIAKKRADLVE